MSDQTQFTVGRVQHIIQKSGEIGSDEVMTVGVREADITCACGHTWTAKQHQDLENVFGGVRVTCPVCHASALTPTRLFRVP